MTNQKQKIEILGIPVNLKKEKGNVHYSFEYSFKLKNKLFTERFEKTIEDSEKGLQQAIDRIKYKITQFKQNAI